MKKKNYSEAMKYYQQCAQLVKSYQIKSLMRMVKLLFDHKAYPVCISFAELLIEKKVEDTNLYFYYAAALSEIKKYTEADSMFNRAVELSNLPLIKVIYLYQGLNAYHQKEYRRSIRIYKRLLAFDPDYGDAYFNLAIVYDDFYKDKRLAIQNYEKFLALARQEKGNAGYIESAEKRLARLKEEQFFQN